MLTKNKNNYYYNSNILQKRSTYMMKKSIKQITLKQYQNQANHCTINNGKALIPLNKPAEGWITTIRKALHMSIASLAKRLNRSTSVLYRTEQAEREGAITLKLMHDYAKALNCHFVYGFVPVDKVENILEKQVKYKVKKQIKDVNVQMEFEEQQLSKDDLDFEKERLIKEILYNLPHDIWDE